MYISSSVTTTNCQLYSYISQILRLYKIWGYYNKFDSMKSLGVYYCYVKISKCAYMKHGLEYIMFYVKNHIAHPSIYSNPLPVCDKLLGAPAFVTHLLIIFFFFWWQSGYTGIPDMQLSEPVLEYCPLDPCEQTSVKFKPKYKHFHSRNAFANVICEMVSILSWFQCVMCHLSNFVHFIQASMR